MANTQLQTDRVILRPWNKSDIEPFAAMCADDKVMEFFPNLYSYDQSAQWIDHTNEHLEKTGFTFWAMEIPGVSSFAGFTGLAEVQFKEHFTPCVQIAWRLAFDHWGQGYVSEAAREVLSYGFNHFDLEEVVSYAVEENKRSLSVMERIGMRRVAGGDFQHPSLPEGHHLKRHVLYRLLKSDWQKSL